MISLGERETTLAPSTEKPNKTLFALSSRTLCFKASTPCATRSPYAATLARLFQGSSSPSGRFCYLRRKVSPTKNPAFAKRQSLGMMLDSGAMPVAFPRRQERIYTNPDPKCRYRLAVCSDICRLTLILHQTGRFPDLRRSHRPSHP